MHSFVAMVFLTFNFSFAEFLQSVCVLLSFLHADPFAGVETGKIVWMW